MTATNLTRAEVLANRQKVITFLIQPKRKKAVGALDKGNGARCCLGHMCYSLGIERNRAESVLDIAYVYGKRKNSGVAPIELVSMVGLNTCSGVAFGECLKMKRYENQSALTTLNDTTDATPKEIGQYLQSVIEGGTNTPWLPLDHYPETL